jgi:hypothetical protein
MKKTKVKCVFIVMAISMALSCKNNVNVQVKNGDNSAQAIAEDYFNIVCMQSNMVNARALTEESYPDILYETIITDENDEIISFADLDAKSQKEFYEIWKEDFIGDLTGKLLTDSNLKEIVEIENEAFIETASSSSRAVFTERDIESFFKQYEKNFNKLVKNSVAARGASSGNSLIRIEDGEIIPESLKIFSENYKKGRFLVNTNSSDSDISGYLGHTSLMCYDNVEPNWAKDISLKATITSYPLNTTKGTTWVGQTDGVQYEPVGYWCGTKGAPTVLILDVYRTVWKWFTKTAYMATDEEHNTAVDKADDHLGKPYNWDFVKLKKDKGMWDTDKFYCSSLVFRAWYDTNKKYSLNTNILYVRPASLVASNNSIIIARYENEEE